MHKNCTSYIVVLHIKDEHHQLIAFYLDWATLNEVRILEWLEHRLAKQRGAHKYNHHHLHEKSSIMAAE